MSAILAPPYSQYKSYSAGDYVTFNGNNYYIALVDVKPQQSPTTSPNSWQQVFNSSGSSFITAVANTATINLTVTAGTLTADALAGGGTVTSVAALTLGTTGTDLSSTVATATTTPVITLNVPTASAANRGALSAADWTTFNSKISGLVVGTTTITGGTDKRLLYDNAGVLGEIAVPTVGKILRSDGTSWLATTATYPDTTTINRILYSSANDVVGQITTANSSVLVTDGSGVPSLSTTLPNGILATTQSQADGSTKLATTQYVDTAANAVAAVNSIMKTYQALGSALLAQTCGLSVDRITTSGATIADGYVTFIALEYLRVAQTITGIKWWQSIIGNYTSNNNNKVGLYSYSGGTLTLVASSADDGTLWKTFASGSLGNKAFSASYAAAAGQYYVGLIYNQSAVVTVPTLGVAANMVNAAVQSLDFTNSAKLQGIITGQTDLPATQAMSGVTATVNQTWVGVY